MVVTHVRNRLPLTASAWNIYLLFSSLPFLFLFFLHKGPTRRSFFFVCVLIALNLLLLVLAKNKAHDLIMYFFW